MPVRSRTLLAWSLWLGTLACLLGGLAVTLAVTRPLTSDTLVNGAVEGAVDAVEHPEKVVAAVRAVHRSEERVGTALEGEVEVGDALRVRPHDVEQLAREVAGFQTAKPQAAEPAHLFAERVDELP